MSTPRLPTPPRPTRPRSAGQQQGQPRSAARLPAPEDADALHRIDLDAGEGERKVVRQGSGSVERSESIPVPGEGDFEEALGAPLPKVSSGGRRGLKDMLAETGEELQEAGKGIGPSIVILHDGVTGPGSRGLGALSKGRVVRLSRLLGADMTQAFIDNPKDARALRALRHYMNPDDPAIREATSEEAKFDEVTFIEGEEEALKALEGNQAQMEAINAENERLRALVAALGRDPDADVSEILASAGISGDVAGGSDESRLPPKEANPPKTGDSDDPGKRDPGFTQQQPQRQTAVERGEKAVNEPPPPGAAIQEQEPDFADEFETEDTNPLAPQEGKLPEGQQ